MQIPANIPLVSGKSIFQFLEYSRFTYHSLFSLSRFFKYPHKAFFGIIFVRFCPIIFRWFMVALVLFSTLDFLDSLAGLAHSESLKNVLLWLPFFEAASSAWARNNSSPPLTLELPASGSFFFLFSPHSWGSQPARGISFFLLHSGLSVTKWRGYGASPMDFSLALQQRYTSLHSLRASSFTVGQSRMAG